MRIDPIGQFLYDYDNDGAFSPDDVYPTVILKANTIHDVRFYSLGYGDGVSSQTDLTEEIKAEMNDHLFCFEVTNNVASVTYKDEDSKHLPFGFHTEWTAGAAGTTGQVKITLRHLPGTKTSICSSEGTKDFEVVIPIEVVD